MARSALSASVSDAWVGIATKSNELGMRPMQKRTFEKHEVQVVNIFNPCKMSDGLRAAQDRNDEVLERIYIGRRFKNDTERLEKLFDLYAKMTKAEGAV
ncbi:type IIL restriction-modification enzyme MmeI [Yunchengibacter salinarum]|uniref:type IIL restriction-modification enzyme MmeI n=1 Tax=Yunchengibacter salinarum TaxID=3133399 RepID=UPI0035B5E4A8